MYLGEDPSRHTPYGVPALAEDLRGLPPAIVVTAEMDPIRDGGEAYGARLRDAGVQTALLRYPGVYHGFLMQESIARTRLAIVEIGALLQAKLAHLASLREGGAAGDGGTPAPAYLTPAYAPGGSARS